MPFDFPQNPTNGQQITGPGGVVFTWDGTKWVTGTGGGNVAFAPLNNPTFVGDPRAPTAPMGDADTSIATTAFVTPAYANVGRNLLHNPLMNIAQRGAGSWSVGNQYTADRWFYAIGAPDACTVSINSLSDTERSQIGDEAARVGLGSAVTGSATASAFSMLLQKIEGVRRLAGKTVTVSFWAYWAQAGRSVGVGAAQNFGTGGSPSAQVVVNCVAVPVGTVWARYTATLSLPSSSGKTLGSNGDDSTEIEFWLSSSSTYASRSNIGVQTGNFNIWGVQLEIGAVATPLEKLDPQVDLANCQRFYVQTSVFGGGYQSAGQNQNVNSYFPVVMRASPSITIISSAQNVNLGTVYSSGAPLGCAFWAAASASGTANFNTSFAASADL